MSTYYFSDKQTAIDAVKNNDLSTASKQGSFMCNYRVVSDCWEATRSHVNLTCYVGKYNVLIRRSFVL